MRMRIRQFFTKAGQQLLKHYARQQLEPLRVDDKPLFIVWLCEQEELRRQVAAEVIEEMGVMPSELEDQLLDPDPAQWVALCERFWLLWLLTLQPPSFDLEDIVVSVELKVAGGGRYAVAHAVCQEEDEQLTQHLGMYLDAFRDLVLQSMLDSQLTQDGRMLLSLPADGPQTANVEGGFGVLELAESDDN